MKKNLTMQLMPLWLLAFFFFASVPIKAQVKGYAGVTKLIGCGSGANANKAEVSITNVTGGTPPYQYQFNGGAWQTSNVGWLSPGNRNVRIKDSSNNYSSYIPVTVPTASIVPVITKEIFYDCDGRPTLKVGVQNPQPSYRYLFKLDNAPTFSEKYLFQNISTGTHTITVKYEDTTVPSPRMLISEDFGSGPDTCDSNVPSQFQCSPNGNNGTAPGKYVILNRNSNYLQLGGVGSGIWIRPNDHTNKTDPNGRYFFVDIGNVGTGDVLYHKRVNNIEPNRPIRYELYLLNLFKPGYSAALPDVEIRLETTGGVLIASQQSGPLADNNDPDNWIRFSGELNPGNNTSVDIQIRTNAWAAWGCDLCMDDIKVWQTPETCGQEVSTTVSVTTLQMPTISANLSNCSPSNNTLNLVVTPTSSLFTYQYQMDTNAPQNSNVFTGLVMGSTHTFKVHYKPVASVVTLVNEDFGVGNNATANNYVNPEYYFEPMTGSLTTIYNRQGGSKDNTGSLNSTVNGEYAIATHLVPTGAANIWVNPVDASGTPNGRKLLVDLDPSKPVFYMREVSVLPNKRVDFSAALMNLVKAGPNPVCGATGPFSIKVKIFGSKTDTTPLAEATQLLPHSSNNGGASDWKRLSLSIPAATVGSRTSLYFTLEIVLPTAGCEDVAVDDIVITQALAECTKDFTTTINTSVTNAFAGVTKLIGCGTGANANNAEVTIANVEGGSGTYEYSFDGITWTASNTSWLPVGTHTVSVRDAVTHGCPFDMSVTVPAALAQPTIKTEVFYACDGKAILNIGVDNPDPALKYLYSLDGAAYTTTYLYTNVASGTHSISIQYEHRDVPSPSILMKEDFGKGDPTSNSWVDTNYFTFKDPRTAGIIQAEYTVAAYKDFIAPTAYAALRLPYWPGAPASYWREPLKGTTTGGNDDRYLYADMAQATYNKIFLEKEVTIDPNHPIEFSFQLASCDGNGDYSFPPRKLSHPNMQIKIVDATNPAIQIAAISSGSIPHDGQWHLISSKDLGTLNPNGVSRIKIQFMNLEQDDFGNDIAIDDITVWQMPAACGQVVSTTKVISPTTQDIPTFTVTTTHQCNTNKGTLTVSPTATGFTYTYTLSGTTQTNRVFTNVPINEEQTVTITYQPTHKLVLLNEDFGTGTVTTSPYVPSKYYFQTLDGSPIKNRDGQTRTGTTTAPKDQEYRVAKELGVTQPFWHTTVKDHTGNTDGRMLFIWPQDAVGEIVYQREISVLPNNDIDYSLWAKYYVVGAGPAGGNPTIQAALYKSLADVAANANAIPVNGAAPVTHTIPGNNVWTQLSYKVKAADVGNVTKLYLVVRDNTVNPSGGNDLALDDIVVTQKLPVCSTTVTGTITPEIRQAFAGVTQLIGCGTGANTNKAKVVITNVLGGSGNYEYKIDGGWVATNTGWLPVGTRTVSVRDAVTHGCQYDMSVTVPAKLQAPTVKTEVHYACDGKAILAVHPEAQDGVHYTYSLDGGAYTTTNVFADLATGTHSVGVKYEYDEMLTPHMLLKQDFGVGPEYQTLEQVTVNASTTYTRVLNPAASCYHGGLTSDIINHYYITDGRSIVESECWDNYRTPPYYTGRYGLRPAGNVPRDPSTPGGRYLFIDLDNTGEVFRQKIKDINGAKAIEVSMKLYNPAPAHHIKPELQIKLVSGSTEVYSSTTIEVPAGTEWNTHKFVVDPKGHTELDFVIYSNRSGALGNDVAIDDIVVWQASEACGNVYTVTKVISPTTQDIPAFTVSKTYDCATGKGVLTVTPTATTGFTYTYTLGSTTYTSTTATFTGLDLEQTYTVSISYQSASKTVTLLKEDFGEGTTAVRSSYTGNNIFYNPNLSGNYTVTNAKGEQKAHTGGMLQDGEYTVARNLISPTGTWRNPNDHSGKPNGRMYFVNPPAGTSQTIYAREVSVLANRPLTFSGYFYNLYRNTGGNNPKVELVVYKNKKEYEDNLAPLKSFTSNDIPANGNNANAWKQEKVELTATEVGARSSVYVVVRMVNPVASGHDMAMDDIAVTQTLDICPATVAATLTKGDIATPTLTLPANLSVICSAPTASATISSWIASATATSTCGTATVTHNYTYPSNLCNVGGAVTVTFSTTDPFGNVVTATRVISFATMTLTVTPTTLSVPNGALGGTTSSVVPNITLGNTVSPSTNSVTITFSGLPTGVTSTTGGRLIVAPNTPAGTHTITYKVCETAGNNNCKTVTSTLVIGTGSLTVTPVTPLTVPNGISGGTTSSVLTGITLNGATVTNTNSVTISFSGLPTGVTSNTNGQLVIPAGTPAGTHTITYRVCEKLNPTNCHTVTSTLVIGTGSLTVTPVTPLTVSNGISGGTTSSVLTGITLNGATVTNTNSVTISFSGLPTGVTSNTNGQLVIPAGTPAGTHTITYKVCEKLNPTNCQTVTSTLVIGTGSLTVTSTTLTHPNGTQGGTTTGTVLTGVKINGNPVNTASVTITWNTLPPNATGNASGTVTIAPNTPAGTYTISYTVCERLNGNSNCQSVTSQITIGGGSLTATSTNLTHPNGTQGGTTTGTVLTGVKINGNPVNTASVTITWNSLPPNATGNASGTVTIAPNTPAGTYTISYTVCERLNGNSNCQSVTSQITIGGGNMTVTPTQLIVANGATGGTSVNNVLTGVTINGNPVNTNSVTITWNSLPPGFTGTNSGTVTVPANTPAGTYTVSYTVCERLNQNNNCKTVTSTIIVGNGNMIVVPTPITVPNGTIGGTSTPSVLTGVVLNGNSNPAPNTVSITWNSLPPRATGNNDGTVNVAPNTPAGTYTVSYTICEALNSGHCTTVTSTITIGGGVLTVTPVTTLTVANGAQGGTTTSSVLTGVSLNGQPANSQSVTITFTGLPAGVTSNTNGQLVVAPGTPATNTTIYYTVCETLNANNNCHTYSTTLVIGTPNLSVTPRTYAIPDATVGGTTSSVLETVTIDGHTPSSQSVTITFGNLPVGIQTTTSGGFRVPAGTPTGIHTVTYTVCEVLNPDHCVTSIATIAVGNVPVVTPNAFTYTGTATVTTPSILDDDTVGTQSATTGTGGNVVINITSTPTGTVVPSLDANNGRVTIPAGTPPGIYTITYDVCTTATPTACTPGAVVITIPNVPVITPDDMVYTDTTTTTAGNILTNDRVGTQSATAGNGGNVSITVTIPATPKAPGATVPTLNPNTGVVTVPAGTPSGTYTITYKICTTATPTSCDTGVVTITVSGTVTEAPDTNDVTAYTRINTPVTVGVTSSTTVMVSIPSQPANGTAVSNGDGTITYTPNNGFKGTDSFEYSLCNAAGCRTATISVRVTSELIIYNGVSIGGSDKNNHFHIEGIENYPNNTVRIYNRWGVKVFEMSGYNNTTKAFRGVSDARATLEASDNLPQGTYYYIVEYVDEHNKTQTETGWLYLKKN